MHKDFIKNFCYLLIIAGLFACKDKKENEESTEASSTISLSKEQLTSSNIQIGSSQEHKMSVVIVSNGIVDVPPQYKATVSTSAGGFVKSTEVLEGDHVHKGELLAVLTHPDYVQMQEQFLEAKSRYMLAEKQLNRQKELREENINSEKKLEESEADLKITKAQMKALEAKLKMIGLNPDKISDGNITSSIEITSPITGDVATVNTSLGKFIKPEEEMFEVISKEHLHLDLKVYENDVLKIKEKQRISYKVGNEGTERPAKIILVGKKLDPASRTVSIHAHPEKSDGLLPGMYVRASIYTEEKSAQTLPEEALVKEGNKNYIFIKTGEDKGAWLFKKVPVDIGSMENNLVEIKAPFMESYKDNIVLKGAYYINSQAAIQDLEEE